MKKGRSRPLFKCNRAVPVYHFSKAYFILVIKTKTKIMTV